MPSNPSRLKPICACSSYSFPHRISGGHCNATCSTSARFNYVTDKFDYTTSADPICSGCGQPADVQDMDFGVGSYEYWGSTGVHTDWQTVSCCCEKPMMPNTWPERAKQGWGASA